MKYLGVVILVVLMFVLTLPFQMRKETETMERWNKIKSNWKTESFDNKAWLVGQYIIAVMFMLCCLLFLGMLIQELYARWF